MILARYRVESYASRREHLANAYLAAVPERRVVLAYDVFAKARPLLDPKKAPDGTGCGTDGSADNRPKRAGRSSACGRTLFGSTYRALRVRGERQTHDHEGGNCKGFNLHDCSFLCDAPAS